jgi:hypothetical protein
MISILNSISIVMFYPTRWTKLNHTCIYFKEFLNQLNLFYKYRMSIYACLMIQKKPTGKLIVSSCNFLQIWRRKSATVESVLSTVSLNVSFRRFLNDNNLVLRNDLIGRIMHIRLNDQNDVFFWNLHQHHSLYLALIYNGMANNMHKQVWRKTVPLKIKIFMWYMKRWS